MMRIGEYDSVVRREVLSVPSLGGLPLNLAIQEVRSDFGRYPEIYRSFSHHVGKPEAWTKPLNIATFGVGFNEEPLTLAIILAEQRARLVAQTIDTAQTGTAQSEFSVHVFSSEGFVMQELRRSNIYPFQHSLYSVKSGLTTIFGATNADALIDRYFDTMENGDLTPKESLTKHIRYHLYSIGTDKDLPSELAGSCRFVAVHNVLQYLKPPQARSSDSSNQNIDKDIDFSARVEASFQAIRTVLHADGLLSQFTDSKLAPEVETHLPILNQEAELK